MNLIELFRTPPQGYGIVPFYWWMGDPLTRERINWQLERLAGHHLTGLQINYAHSFEGGRSWGLTYPSEPPVFSEEWWDLVGWLIEKGKEQGFSVSLSDYTFSGAGQGGYTDHILKDHPDLHGFTLEWDGKNVQVKPEPYSLNPMHPLSGKLVCDYFFGEFERRFPGETGRSVNFFFSDELDFGLRGRIWTGDFAAEFKNRKGYDVEPLLSLLFEGSGPKAVKVRLDYSDVMVQLEEERYFKPVYDWHEERGMIFGCDHGGRGRDVVEFGDYFRTQKYNQGPGCDQPALHYDIIKNKVASSIAHLYERKRVWLEGFYGSGWGTSSADIRTVIARNFVMGQNLWSPHGLYYSTYGGFWEWAPPCNCWRMPYWNDMSLLTGAVERLGFLLSRGKHVADIAVVYPVAAVEADGTAGKAAANTAFKAVEDLYKAGLDLDFIDFESIVRAECENGYLRVSGEAYRIVILPAMEAVRFSMLEKLLKFSECGGVVIALDVLPRFSDRSFDSDPELSALIARLFPNGPGSSEGLVKTIRAVLGTPDFAYPAFKSTNESEEIYINHRRIEDRDIYMVYGVPKGRECFFRAGGQATLWNPYNGKRLLLSRVKKADGGTLVTMPLEADEITLICFDREGGTVDGEFQYRDKVLSEQILDGLWNFSLLPCLDNSFGDFRQPVEEQIIGPELRFASYIESDEETPPSGSYTHMARFGYGPWLQKAGPFAGASSFDRVLAAAIRGNFADFEGYEFSWRWGVWNDPGIQGCHGLKKLISDEFLTIGEKHETGTGTEYRSGPSGDGAIFAARLRCDHPMEADILSGGKKPDMLFVDGVSVSADRISLDEGIHNITFAYRESGRGYLVFAERGQPASTAPTPPLSMTWNTMPNLLRFDGGLNHPRRYTYFRFMTPPGLLSMELPCDDEVRVWIGGKEAALSRNENYWIASSPIPVLEPVEAFIRVEPAHGGSGGALINERIRFRCGPGKVKAVDWSNVDGLACYSGGAEYRTTVNIEGLPSPIASLCCTDLVSSARLWVNDIEAGTRLAPPWDFDLNGLLKNGMNEFRLVIHNTLANHYLSIPTRYRGSTASGLMGPVYLRFYAPDATFCRFRL
ncbi:hypothetical protein FACS189442_2870 [Spirochaetia bacterium]|nr:hypothetical protein FACS189442_2870 [Spirochaetia bacterium]